MENKLVEKTLRNGEQVRWQGKPQRFRLLESDAKVQILGQWIGTCIAAVAILILYMENIGGDSKSVTLGVVLVAAALIAAPVIERHRVLLQHYWITDQRAILMTGERTFYFMELSEIDDFQVVHEKAGKDCLVLGSAVFEDIDRQLRWRACHPKTAPQASSRDGRADGLIFFNVEDSGSAKVLLSRNVKKMA